MAGKKEQSPENHLEHVLVRMTSMRLELLSRHRIRDPGLGLNEPSRVKLNRDGSALYTVSDDTKAIFRLDLKGRVSVTDLFFIGLDDFDRHWHLSQRQRAARGAGGEQFCNGGGSEQPQ